MTVIFASPQVAEQGLLRPHQGLLPRPKLFLYHIKFSKVPLFPTPLLACPRVRL